MQTSIFNNAPYYESSSLRTNHPSLFQQCKADRDLIHKHQLSSPEALYMSYSKKMNTWKPCSNKYKRAKIFISKLWVDQMVSMQNNVAPSILVLEDHEQFQDINGETLCIETRGERQYNQIYFSALDVSRVFEMPNLIRTITHNDSNYEENTDYKKMFVEEDRQSKYFLTFGGLLRVVFGSQSIHARNIRKCAEEILYIHKMGEEEQKQQQAAKLVGVPINSFKASISTSYSCLPAIYLISIGQVKDLRKSMNLSMDLPGNAHVFKYGLTKNIKKRSEQHYAYYKKLQGSRVSMYKFQHIDPIYLSDAEIFIRDEFLISCATPVKYKQARELICISLNTQKIAQIEKCFAKVCDKFGGKIKELIEKYEKEVENMKHTMEKKLWKHLVTHNCSKRLYVDTEAMEETDSDEF